MDNQPNSDQSGSASTDSDDEAIFEGNGRSKNALGIIPSEVEHPLLVGVPSGNNIPLTCIPTDFGLSLIKGSTNSESFDPWELSELAIQKQKLSAECNDLRHQLSNYQEENYNLQMEKDELEHTLSQRGKALQEKVRQLEEEIEVARSVALATDEVNTSCKDRIILLEQESIECESKFKKLRTEADAVAYDLECCQKKLRIKEKEIEIISRDSKEYIENWIAKDKKQSEETIMQLQETIDSLKASNNILNDASRLLDGEENYPSFFSESMVSRSGSSEDENKFRDATTETSTPSPYFDESTESLRSEISCVDGTGDYGFGISNSPAREKIIQILEDAVCQTEIRTEVEAESQTDGFDQLYCTIPMSNSKQPPVDTGDASQQTEDNENETCTCVQEQQTEIWDQFSVSQQTEVSILCSASLNTDVYELQKAVMRYDPNRVVMESQKYFCRDDQGDQTSNIQFKAELYECNSLKKGVLSERMSKLVWRMIGFLAATFFTSLMLSFSPPVNQFCNPIFGIFDVTQYAIKHGRLEHLDRPII